MVGPQVYVIHRLQCYTQSISTMLHSSNKFLLSVVPRDNPCSFLVNSSAIYGYVWMSRIYWCSQQLLSNKIVIVSGHTRLRIVACLPSSYIIHRYSARDDHMREMCTYSMLTLLYGVPKHLDLLHWQFQLNMTLIIYNQLLQQPYIAYCLRWKSFMVFVD